MTSEEIAAAVRDEDLELVTSSTYASNYLGVYKTNNKERPW